MVITRSCKLSLQILIFSLLIDHCIGQSYLFSAFPAEKELSSRQITSLFQDSKGFMWIGTEDGLNFYNANSIKIFKHDVRNKNSLINNYVQNICEDKNGNLWIGTATGVDCYNPSENSFRHFTVDDQKNSFGFKSKVYTDRKGNLWIGNDGLFKFDSVTQQFKKIINPYSNSLFGSRLANIITGFFQDSHNHYWVSTRDGFFAYDDVKKNFERIDVPPTNENYKKFGILFSNAYEDRTGTLWVGSWGYGVFKVLPRERKLISLGSRSVSLTYTSQKLGGEDLLWYTDNGLVGINTMGEIKSSQVYNNNDPFSLRNEAITTLFTDRQGQLWIGYTTQGIQIMSPGNQLIKTYPVSRETDRHKISSVGAVFKKNNSVYLGGWYADAVCKLGPDFKVAKWWERLPPEDENGNNVSDFYDDKNGNIWITTFNGLVCLDEKTGDLKKYKYDSTVNKNNRFLKILPEGDSVLWLAGYDNGLSRFSLRTHSFQMMENGMPRPLYWKIMHDKNDNLSSTLGS